MRVGGWLIQPRRNRIFRDNREVSLPTRFMDLLVFLAANQGKVVSKEEIVEAVWEKEYISDGTLTHAVAAIRQALGDDSRNPEFIETIPTRGYRMLAPVEPVDDGGLAGVAAKARGWRLVAAAAAVVGLTVALTATIRLLAGGEENEGGVRRLMVMPFENLGPAERTDIAAGVTDALTTRLAAVPGIGVISRISAQSVASSGRSARQIGEELGVDYLLVGTVRWEPTAGGRGEVGVNAQLVRAADDTHLWAGTYNRPVENVFEAEAEIAGNVLGVLGLAVQDPVRRRLGERPTANVDAYQAYLCAARYEPYQTRDHLGLAQAMYERSVQLDPSFALAWAQLGVVHARLHDLGIDPSPERLHEADLAVRTASALQPDLPEVHRALGAYYLLGVRDYRKALQEFALAAQQLPNDSELLALTADAKRRLGRWHEARYEIERSYSLDPRNYLIALALGDTLSGLREYEAADRAYDQAMSLMPDAAHPYVRRFWNALRGDGDLDRASEILDRLPGPSRDDALFSVFCARYFQRDFEGARAVAAAAGREEVTTPTMRAPVSLLECMAQKALGREAEAARQCRSALALLETGIPGTADDPRSQIGIAYAYALLGNPDEAVDHATRATTLCPIEEDAYEGPAYLGEAARVFALAGERERALDALGLVLLIPSPDSANTARLDPRFDVLRTDPRFQRLTAAK